jgi:spermidine synthase
MSDRASIGFFFAFGFAATAGQVLLLRLAIILGGGNELVLGAFFGAWFLGIALGAARGRRVPWSPAQFRLLAGLLPALLFLNAVLVMLAAATAPPACGHGPSLGRGMLLASVLGLLPGAVIGFAFPAGAAVSRGIAQLFLWESAGSCAGGLLASIVFVRFKPFGALAILAVAGLALLPGRWRLLAFGAGLGLWASWAPLEDLRLHAFHPVGQVVVEADSPYQHILLTEYSGQRALHLNGQVAGQSPDPASALRWRILRELSGGRGEAALLSGWPGGTEKEAGPVRWIQPDRTLARLFAETEASGLRATVADPRALLSWERARFALILLDLPPPVSVAQERLFTREFFEAAAGALRPGGVLAVVLPAPENYWGAEISRLSAGLTRTLQAAFPEVVAAVGPMPLLLASNDPGALSARLGALRNGEEASLYSALFPPERMEAFRRRMAALPGRLAADARPFSYLDALAVKEKMDRQVPVAGAITALAPWSLALFWLGVLPFLPRRNRPLAQVFSSGVLGIGLFLLLSLRYQAAHGVYYGAVGILTGLFMLGLGISAPLGRRLAVRSAAPWLPDAASLGLLAVLQAIPSAPSWIFGLLFALSGAVTGLPFVCQGIRLGDDPAAAARMQFHDHLGAALGAVASGLLLMPLLGLTGTVLALAGMKGVSLVLNLRATPT